MFCRYKELAGLSVMQPYPCTKMLTLAVPSPPHPRCLQCVITFKDRSLDLIAPHAYGIAVLMLVSPPTPPHALEASARVEYAVALTFTGGVSLEQTSAACAPLQRHNS